MLMEIEQHLLPTDHPHRPGIPMTPKGVLYHTTNNWDSGADAWMHVEYMKHTKRMVSWHVTIDAERMIQTIPFDEMAWHAGDGRNGVYNRHWIGVEICCNRTVKGKALDQETYRQAVEGIAYIMHLNGLDKLQPHRVVYGKNCPHHTLLNEKRFEADVFKRLKKKDFGFDSSAARKVIDVLGAVYMASADRKVQQAAHFAADALREAANIE